VWIGLALLVAAAGGVAAWYFLLRPLPPRPASLQPTPLPKAASSPADVATPPISPSPEAGSTAPPATASTPVATPSAKAASGGGSPAEARAALQRGDLAAAGREFTATLRAAPRGAFSIQILVACSADTVFKALQSAPAPELFVLPVNYKGRDCHRLCWGTYDSRERAQSAIHSVPAYFREGGASPKVVAASEILP
jgi:septal ring-binding cell division protein DamX